jgi:hypothetical protein
MVDAENEDHYPLMGPWTVRGENVTVTPSNDITVTFGNVTLEGITTFNIAQTGQILLQDLNLLQKRLPTMTLKRQRTFLEKSKSE